MLLDVFLFASLREPQSCLFLYAADAWIGQLGNELGGDDQEGSVVTATKWRAAILSGEGDRKRNAAKKVEQTMEREVTLFEKSLKRVGVPRVR